MNDIRYPVLKEIDGQNGIDYVTLLNRMHCPPATAIVLLKQMKKDGIIRGAFEAYNTVSLTDKGVSLFLQMENEIKEEADKNAKEHEESRRQTIQKEKDRKKNIRDKIIIGVVSSVVAFLITHFIENFNESIEFIVSFFS